MAVGAYIYVGKSRVRRKNKEKRRKRKEESRRRSPPPAGGSPCSGRVRYSVLTSSSDDGDDLSLLGGDVEADRCSTGSSGSEDLLPLIDLDIALDLRPQSDKHLPRLKMPFDFFKRKNKKAEEKKEDVPAKEEVKVEEEKPDQEAKHWIGHGHGHGHSHGHGHGHSHGQDTERDQGHEKAQGQGKDQEKPQEKVDEVVNPEPEPEVSKTEEKPVDEGEKEPEEKGGIVEALKEAGDSLKADVQNINNEMANGDAPKEEKQPLQLEKHYQDENEGKTGVICCTIL